MTTNIYRLRALRVLLLVAAVVAATALPATASAPKVFVSDVSPDGDSINVAADSNITATFDQAMSERSIKDTTFYLKQQGSRTVVPARVAYDPTTKTATLNPNNDLASGATYTAYVKGGRKGVKSTGGGKLGGTTDDTATFTNGKVTWSFTVATPPQSDTTPPTVSSVTPSHGATGVATSTNVTATFSEAMDSGTITNQSFTLAKSGGSPVSAQVTYDENSSTATLNPDQDLEADAIYNAKVTTAVEDLAGNAMVQEKTWTFTTLAGVTITPNPLHFSVSGFCFIQSKLLTVTNNSPGDVTFADVSITGPDATLFSSGAKGFLAANGPFTLLAGNHFFDEVTFIPEGISRTYSATLTYKDETGATLGKPVTLTAQTVCLTV